MVRTAECRPADFPYDQVLRSDKLGIIRKKIPKIPAVQFRFKFVNHNNDESGLYVSRLRLIEIQNVQFVVEIERGNH